MAKDKKTTDDSSDIDSTLMNELSSHYAMWTEDNDKRATRKDGWNTITDAYYGVLPPDWPYTSRVVDPRIRTSLIEKNARLVNGKLRGRLVPREGGDTLKAEIKNAMLDHNWDNANEGGTMNAKIALADLDTRLYGSKFALVKWKTERDSDGKLIYDANEMIPLDLRDCGIDPASTHIRNAKWFQHRAWEFVEDLETQTDVSGAAVYENIGKLKRLIKEKQQGKSSQRKNKYISRVKQIRGLEDRTGEDIAFPIAEIVTEYRCGRWITFSPEYKIVLRDIPTPYKHKKIPVAQLRYYQTQDDPIGESEVEPVLPLWRAIQATICGYMDEVILKQRPPLKVIEGAVRIETIVYGPEAQWLMDRPDAVTEMQSNGEAVRYFQTTYGALTSAFNTATGDLSQGTSAVDPFNTDKTATEVRATERQRNVRDQKNQNDLADFIKDIMLMWCSNMQQFVFSDPKKQNYVLKIVGREKFKKFLKAGYGDMELPYEVTRQIQELIEENPDMSDDEIVTLSQIGLVPKYPVVEDPSKPEAERSTTTKLKMGDDGDTAELYIVPEDLEGVDDYIPDVKSMASSYEDDMMKARTQLLGLITSNPATVQMLASEGYRPKMKDILVDTLTDTGLRDSERYFEKLEISQSQYGQPTQPNTASQAAPGGIQPPGGASPLEPTGGVPPVPQAAIGASALQ